MITTLKQRLDKLQSNVPVIPKTKVRLASGEIVTMAGYEIIGRENIQEIIEAEDITIAQLAYRLSGETIKMPSDFALTE